LLVWFYLILIGIGIPYNIIVGGSSSRGASVGFGNLWIQYDSRSGGLLGERVGNIVIVYTFPRGGQRYDESSYTCLLDDGHAVTVQSRWKDTLWVDEKGDVTNLGQVLGARDIAMLRKFESQGGSVVSSPEEFLSALAELRAYAGVPNEPSAAAARKRREAVAKVVKAHFKSKYAFETRGPLTLTQFDKEEKESYGHSMKSSLRIEGEPFFADSLEQGGCGWFRLHSRQGDQLYFFTSDPRSWSDLAGKRGYVLVRKNEIIESMVESTN
jgi:hypothetical protein